MFDAPFCSQSEPAIKSLYLTIDRWLFCHITPGSAIQIVGRFSSSQFFLIYYQYPVTGTEYNKVIQSINGLKSLSVASYDSLMIQLWSIMNNQVVLLFIIKFKSTLPPTLASLILLLSLSLTHTKQLIQRVMTILESN